MYNYKAKVIKVIDGDTVDLNIDLGFHIWVVKRVRLSGIDTPELYTQTGKTAKAFVENLLPIGLTVTITTKLDSSDKYGRVLGEITIDNNLTSLNKILLNNGLASPYNG